MKNYQIGITIFLIIFSINISNSQSNLIYLGEVGYKKTKLVLNNNKAGKVTGELKVLESESMFKVDGNIENGNIELKLSDKTLKKIAVLIGKIEGYNIKGSLTNIDGSGSEKFEFVEMVVPEMGKLEINESFSGGDIKISLPKLINHSVPSIERGFNREVKEIYSDEYQEWTQEVKNTDDLGKLHVDIDYEMIEQSPTFISVLISEYVYNEGAAHGSVSYEVLNYSIKKQKAISDYEVKKIIDESSGRLVVLINEALMKIDQDYTGCLVENVESIPIPNITAKELVFTFGSYQLGAYACGSPSVRIPFSSLD